MKFFRKTKVAVATLILSIAAALAIGQIKAAPVQPEVPIAIEQVVEREANRNGEVDVLDAFSTFIVDDAGILTKEQKEELANKIANMSILDKTTIACQLQAFPEGTVTSGSDLDKTAERIFDKLELSSNDAVIFIDPVNKCYYVSGGSDFINTFSNAELNNFKATLEEGFGINDQITQQKLGEAINDAYDVLARVVSNPDSFEDYNGRLLKIEDDKLTVVESKGFFGIAGSLFGGVFGVVKTILIGAFVIVVLVICGIVIPIIVKGTKNSKKKRENQNKAETASGNGGQSGAPGKGIFGGKGGAAGKGSAGANIGGNIDTSTIETNGSQYRWSANKNPYSGLNKGKSTNASGFSFPGMGDEGQEDSNKTGSV